MNRTDFSRLANLTPRAWWRLHRRLAHVAWRELRHPGLKAAQETIKKLEGNLSEAKLREGFARQIEEMEEREVVRLQKLVNDLLSHGFQFKVDMNATYEMLSLGELRCEWTTNRPPVTSLRSHMVRLERMGMTFPIDHYTAREMKWYSIYPRQLALSIGNAVAEKVMECLMQQGNRRG